MARMDHFAENGGLFNACFPPENCSPEEAGKWNQMIIDVGGIEKFRAKVLSGEIKTPYKVEPLAVMVVGRLEKVLA